MDFCDERFSRTLDKLDTIGKKVDNLSKKFDGFKTKEEKEAEAEARDWRTWLLSIASGAIVALIAYFIPH